MPGGLVVNGRAQSRRRGLPRIALPCRVVAAPLFGLAIPIIISWCKSFFVLWVDRSACRIVYDEQWTK